MYHVTLQCQLETPPRLMPPSDSWSVCLLPSTRDMDACGRDTLRNVEHPATTHGTAGYFARVRLAQREREGRSFPPRDLPSQASMIKAAAAYAVVICHVAGPE